VEPTIFELIKDITPDAIKILGPAIITAIVAYKISKAQSELKLKEIEKTQQFKAREHLFIYYKERQKQLAQDFAKLSDSLEHDLGLVAGLTDTRADENSELIKTMAQYTQMYSAIMPIEIDITVRDMEKNGLTGIPDFEKLQSYQDKISHLATEKTFQTLQKNILIILEAYRFLQLCNQQLLQKQMEKTFHNYF